MSHLSGAPVQGQAVALSALRVFGLQPEHILDIGANHGDWTRMAQTVFPQAHVLMVEGNGEVYNASWAKLLGPARDASRGRVEAECTILDREEVDVAVAFHVSKSDVEA